MSNELERTQKEVAIAQSRYFPAAAKETHETGYEEEQTLTHIHSTYQIDAETKQDLGNDRMSI